MNNQKPPAATAAVETATTTAQPHWPNILLFFSCMGVLLFLALYLFGNATATATADRVFLAGRALAGNLPVEEVDETTATTSAPSGTTSAPTATVGASASSEDVEEAVLAEEAVETGTVYLEPGTEKKAELTENNVASDVHRKPGAAKERSVLDDARKKLAAAKAKVVERAHGAPLPPAFRVKPQATSLRRKEREEATDNTEFAFTPENYKFASGSAVTAEDFKEEKADWEEKKAQTAPIVAAVLKDFKDMLVEMVPSVEIEKSTKKKNFVLLKDKQTGRCVSFDRFKEFAEWMVSKSLGGAVAEPDWSSEVDFKAFDAGDTDSLRKAIVVDCDDGNNYYRIVGSSGRVYSAQTRKFVNLSFVWPRDKSLLATERIAIKAKA